MEYRKKERGKYISRNKHDIPPLFEFSKLFDD